LPLAAAGVRIDCDRASPAEADDGGPDDGCPEAAGVAVRPRNEAVDAIAPRMADPGGPPFPPVMEAADATRRGVDAPDAVADAALVLPRALSRLPCVLTLAERGWCSGVRDDDEAPAAGCLVLRERADAEPEGCLPSAEVAGAGARGGRTRRRGCGVPSADRR
jgi:hypothetical protein